MTECTKNVALYDQLMATFREVVDREIELDREFLGSLSMDQHTLEHVAKDVLADWAKVVQEEDIEGKEADEETKLSTTADRLLALVYVGLLTGIQIGHNQMTRADT